MCGGENGENTVELILLTVVLLYRFGMGLRILERRYSYCNSGPESDSPCVQNIGILGISCTASLNTINSSMWGAMIYATAFGVGTAMYLARELRGIGLNLEQRRLPPPSIQLTRVRHHKTPCCPGAARRGVRREARQGG